MKPLKGIFLKKHKRIIMGVKIGLGVLGTVALTALTVDNVKKGQTIKVQRNIISKNMDRINVLEDMCEKKDAFAKSLFSKLCREGNSEGARQLAYRRWYLANQ